jgi:predicted phosphodiesterase
VPKAHSSASPQDYAVKLHSPRVRIRISGHRDAGIRLKLLNFDPESKLVKVNGEKVRIQGTPGTDFWGFLKDAAKRGLKLNLVESSLLAVEKGYHLQLPVSPGKETVIRVSPKQIGVEDEGFTFYAVSDTHSGYSLFLSILPDIIAQNPDFMVMNGDFTNGGLPMEYDHAASVLESLPFPVYTTVGNHDVWNSGERFYAKYFGPEYYAFSYRGVHFILLDSARGFLGQRQLSWLRSQLDDARDRTVILLSHIPPIDPRSGAFDTGSQWHPELKHSLFSRTESEYLLALMQKWDVEAYIAGHTHRYASTQVGDTRITTGGTVGGSLLPGTTTGYLRVTVDDGEVDIENVPVTELKRNRIRDGLYSAKVFLLPFLYNRSVRIVASELLLIAISFFWAAFRRHWVSIRDS